MTFYRINVAVHTGHVLLMLCVCTRAGQIQCVVRIVSVYGRAYSLNKQKAPSFVFTARACPVRTAADFNSPQPHVHDMTDV